MKTTAKKKGGKHNLNLMSENQTKPEPNFLAALKVLNSGRSDQLRMIVETGWQLHDQYFNILGMMSYFYLNPIVQSLYDNSFTLKDGKTFWNILCPLKLLFSY